MAASVLSPAAAATISGYGDHPEIQAALRTIEQAHQAELARGIERAVEVYGAERILFGSDGTRFGMQWTSNAIADANLSEAQRDMIRTTNARSVLRRAGRAVSVAA